MVRIFASHGRHVALRCGARRLTVAYLVAFACLTAIGAAPASAAQPVTGSPTELRYGYPEQPPRAFTNAKGEPDGYYPRLLRVLLERAGIPWRADSYPAKRLMINLGTGDTNFSILVRNPELEQCCIYGSKPVWFDQLRAYYVGDKPPLLRREDLAGKRVITLAGFAYGGLIQYINDPANRVANHPAQSHQAAFEMLSTGRADYLLDYAEPANSEGLAKHPIPQIRSSVLDTVHMYFVISRRYPDAENVLQRLESIYQRMREEDPKRELTR